jgi:serine/threonine-protein kinase
MPDLIGTTIGGYTILEQVGRGGMATVFKALDLADGKTVAIKILAPQLAVAENFQQRFRREAKLLRELDHPNIVPVLDFGEANGMVYLVMPFMEVGTLTDRMMSGMLRVQEAARILEQIASALQYAHDKGIVHRDVKPANILLDESGNAWLSDFGFARIHDASLSLTGSALIGTPAYISPEQINGGEVTHLSDQYALGVILYLLSTGELPYDADTPIAIAIKHATEPLPRPRAVNPNLPDSIEAVLIKALAKDPLQRFKSVAEFNEAFQSALKEALDPVSGLLKPGAVGSVPDSPVLEPVSVDEEEEPEEQPSRRLAWVLILLLMLLLPLACFSVVQYNLRGVAAGGNGGVVASSTPTADIEATVDALSTANAPEQGTVMAPGEVETYVAATLTAMATEPIMTEGAFTHTPGIEGSEVPTEDPLKTWTWTPPASATIAAPAATRTRTPTSLPTSTPSKTVMGASSATPSKTKTATPYVSPTRTVSKTATTYISPTPTRTKTPTRTLTPTRTWTPSKTLVPTSTLSPTPSPKPPTPTVDPCEGIYIVPKAGQGFPRDKYEWLVFNSTPSDIFIDAIWINWPSSHGELNKVKNGGDTIWEGEDESPPSSMPPWSTGDANKFKVKSDDDRILKFEFDSSASSPTYTLNVTFNNGCTLSP